MRSTKKSCFGSILRGY